jgi:hypothetical protein
MKNKRTLITAHFDPVGNLDTENELIHHRLSWLLAGQSLLLLAFGNLVSARVSDDAANTVAFEMRERALKYIPRVGFWSAFVVLVGVLAAIVAFVMIIRRDGRSFGVHWTTTILGFVPSVGLPLIFMIAWYKISKRAAGPMAILIPALSFVVFGVLLSCALRTKRREAGAVRDYDG